ncbi:MAG: pyridoxamine 5'-phosphate oxidase family protein [Oryzihumus sp.]|jgi:nitroimidazol reductase NimA-like FMN-containing flavoprotein (pyridoxamine 5'-phosphate oxidase superfamily)
MSEPTERTTVRRLPEKAVMDRSVLDAILDEALVAHLGVTEGDQPFVLPMACARDGDRLLLHGSTGSRLMRTLASGAPTCATVTLVDGLVYARSAFESSMHYRSATILGRASVVPPEEVVEALRVLTEHLLPGRWEHLRPPNRKELAATMVLALPVREWSVKVGDGPPEDDPTDLGADVWAGVLPLRTTAEQPRPAPDLAAGIEVPDHVIGRYPS